MSEIFEPTYLGICVPVFAASQMVCVYAAISEESSQGVSAKEAIFIASVWLRGYAMSLYTFASVLAVQAPAMVDLALSRDERQDVLQRYETPSLSRMLPLMNLSVEDNLQERKALTGSPTEPKRLGRKRCCLRPAGKTCWGFMAFPSAVLEVVAIIPNWRRALEGSTWDRRPCRGPVDERRWRSEVWCSCQNVRI